MRAMFYMPPAELPITDDGPKGYIAQKPWFMFWSQLYTSAVDGLPQAETAVTVGASPHTFTATAKGQLSISGGGGLTIEFTRDGIAFYAAGTAPCMIPLCKGDAIRVTYGVAPTLTFFPM